MNAAPNPLYFLIGFPLFWFAVTMLLSFVSGWYGLMERYPDRAETALAVLANQSGSLGAVSMRGILKLSVCPSGLRLGIMRIFGPFCRDLFVTLERNHRHQDRSLFLESGKTILWSAYHRQAHRFRRCRRSHGARGRQSLAGARILP